jgi:hypothetical protein
MALRDRHTEGIRADPAPPIFTAGRRSRRAPVMDAALDEEKGVAAIPRVLQAQRLFGDPDDLLRIVTTGLAAPRVRIWARIGPVQVLVSWN